MPQIRFDVAYHGAFKCNIRTIRDGYQNLHRWMRQLYWGNAAFKDTCNFEHIKTHYFWSHPFVSALCLRIRSKQLIFEDRLTPTG